MARYVGSPIPKGPSPGKHAKALGLKPKKVKKPGGK